jgi:hypothetical protein
MNARLNRNAPGRKRSHQSARMSESCFRRFFGIGRTVEQLKDIAEDYTNRPANIEAGKTFTDRAIHARIQDFRYKINPQLAAELLGTLEVKIEQPQIAQAKNTTKVTVIKDEQRALVAVLTDHGGALVPA